MNATAHEHNMDSSITRWQSIVSSTVIKTSKHDESLPLLQLGVDDALVARLSKVRLVVAPKVRPGDNARGSVGLEGITGRDKHAKEHVSTLCVLVGLCVSCMVVLVVAVKLLRLASRLGAHGDGDGEKWVRGCDGWLVSVPCRGINADEMLTEVLKDV